MFKWEKETIQYRLTQEKRILKAVEKQYAEALKAIEDRVATLLGRQDADLPNVIHRVEYQRMMKEQVQAILDGLHSNEYETITKYLEDSYTDAFVGTMYSLHHQDIPLILPVSQDMIVKAITLDTKLKSPLYKTLGQDITTLKNTIANVITRGIASGQMYNEIAQNLTNVSGIPKRRAMTIIRTEAGRVQEQATMDAARDAKEKGAEVVKQWCSILDGNTRDSHRLLDGQVREVEEPFAIGNKEAMQPHGFGDPAEDCNCRCTSLIRAVDMLDEEELETLRERASFHGLSVDDSKAFGKAKAKDFSDFKKKYLKAAKDPANTTKTLKNQAKSGIMLVGGNYTSNKGFAIHQDKIKKYLLKPGTKHYPEFHSVGYRDRPGGRTIEARLLAQDIENGYDESKATDKIERPDGSVTFSIFMNLGFGGGKRFRTVWRKDKPDSAPRLITAHREG